MSDIVTRIVVKTVDQASSKLGGIGTKLKGLVGPGREIGAAFGRLGQASGMGLIADSLGNVGKSLGNVTRQAGSFGLKMAAIGGAGGFLFKDQLLDTASQFEKFRTILGTLEGDSGKAASAMNWISDFAARTPYELDQVVGAFVKLRSYGLDPMGGLMKSAGDAAAAMGIDIDQAVEAVADAVTGENERLKGLGITARQAGKRVVYEYSINGQTMRKVAQAGNRAMIQSTIMAIWNEKYAGAMDKLSATFDGMISNLSDQWKRFTLAVMDAGAFDWIKGKVGALLDQVNEMAANGQLAEIAKLWGENLTSGLTAAWSAMKEIGAALTVVGGVLMWAHGLTDSWTPVLATLGTILAGPLLAAVVGLGQAIVGLGVAIGFTPIGWFIGAVAAIAGAAYLVTSKWEMIENFFKGLWTGVVFVFQSAISSLTGMWDDFLSGLQSKIANLTSWMPDKIRIALGLSDMEMKLSGTGARLDGAAVETLPPGFAGRQNVEAGITVRFENAPPGMQVTDVSSNTPGFDVDMDAGPAMVMP